MSPSSESEEGRSGVSTEITDPRLGEILDEKYELTRKLGSGGMGVVYEAVHRVVGRKFAIKFLHPWMATRSDILARFRREAQSAGALKSDHIVAITDLGTAPDGAPYIVMEYLEGRDLGALLDEEDVLPLSRAVDLMMQACRGLSVAHQAGIVHRDLKPDNLFIELGDDGLERLKLVDFGIAKLRAGATSGARTDTGAMIGTLLYMSPEQIRGESELDGRADIYALACILYEMLAGRPPHEDGEPHVVIHRVMHEELPALSELVPGLPPLLVQAVHRALAFDREERFETALDFSQALERFGSPRASSPPPDDAAPIQLKALVARKAETPATMPALTKGQSLGAGQSSDSGQPFTVVGTEVPVSAERPMTEASPSSLMTAWRRKAVYGVIVAGVAIALSISQHFEQEPEGALDEAQSPVIDVTRGSATTERIDTVGKVEPGHEIKETGKGLAPSLSPHPRKLFRKRTASSAVPKEVAISPSNLVVDQNLQQGEASAPNAIDNTGGPSSDDELALAPEEEAVEPAPPIVEEIRKPPTKKNNSPEVLIHRKGTRELTFDKSNPYD